MLLSLLVGRFRLGLSRDPAAGLGRGLSLSYLQRVICHQKSPALHSTLATGDDEMLAKSASKSKKQSGTYPFDQTVCLAVEFLLELFFVLFQPPDFVLSLF